MTDLFEPTWALAREIANTPADDRPASLMSSGKGMVIPMYGGMEAVHLSSLHATDGAAAFREAKRLEQAWMYRELRNENVDAVRLGDTFYRIKRPGKWVITEPRALGSWIETNAARHDEGHTELAWLSLFSASSFKVTALRALAERWGYNKKALDGFVAYVEDGQDTLTPVPIGKAPKFAQKLSDGQRWRKK